MMLPNNTHQNGATISVPLRLATWNLHYDSQPDGILVSASPAALPVSMNHTATCTAPREALEVCGGCV